MERLREMQSPRAWMMLGAAALIIGVVVPLVAPEYMVPLLGKFLCFGIAAMAMDLVWGYAGILSLGHGLFFALGGYGMGMYLMRVMAGEGVYRSNLPDFMVFLDWKQLPWYWHGFQSFPFAMVMSLVAPGLLALVFGYFMFRSRIRGVYLSIVTQALTYAATLFFFQNAAGFGGNNGLTDFKRILGASLHDPGTRKALYVASAIALLGTYLLCRFVVTSRLGRVVTAVRDAELKSRFCGYESTHFKLFIWTLSAMLCALAGALYVPQVGIINPSEMQPSNSIEMAIWVAVGGRGTLGGAVLGAWLVNGGKSWLTAALPSAWLYALGALFVAVTLFLPDGLVGVGAKVTARIRSKLGSQTGGTGSGTQTDTKAGPPTTPILSTPVAGATATHPAPPPT